MRILYRELSLVLLLLMAQQGAVVHELSHFFGASDVELRVESGDAADGTCALCPVFAQVITPAVSHSFHIPDLVRAQPTLYSEPRLSAIDATTPRPRSRGPPSLS
jgi:hypothetical protein